MAKLNRHDSVIELVNNVVRFLGLLGLDRVLILLLANKVFKLTFYEIQLRLANLYFQNVLSCLCGVMGLVDNDDRVLETNIHAFAHSSRQQIVVWHENEVSVNIARTILIVWAYLQVLADFSQFLNIECIMWHPLFFAVLTPIWTIFAKLLALLCLHRVAQLSQIFINAELLATAKQYRTRHIRRFSHFM